MKNLFSGIYKNKTVLVTGHTGFKGSWLVYWLHQMGAKVVAIADKDGAIFSENGFDKNLIEKIISEIYSDKIGNTEFKNLDTMIKELKNKKEVAKRLSKYIQKTYNKPF